MSLRLATAADIPALSRLWHEKMILQQQFDRRLSLNADAVAAWEQGVVGWLGDERCAIYVGGDETDVFGYIIGWIQANPPGVLPEQLGAITDLTLDAHRYQGGLGRMLVGALRGWFAERGVMQLVAYVPARHAVGQAFWRSLDATEWIDLLWLK
ncbi:MAG TPA: GNAT family N-acetyltransferase [Phototrophicaceae bacterium]|nr:GNAT family N-acetyltransferase [Phototrophicaceae bacterium]